ncbi:MAG: TfoX/Sxy family protein [Acidimicrobiia bacterium]|nr:TfoX/Sxy family protein [Acidimicrobiia bacterium]
MAKPKYPGPIEALELYAAVVAGNPQVELKGAKNPYTSRNGHMFSFLGPDGNLALRLSPERYDDFLAAYESGPVESYGAVMRGYVAVPAELLADTEALQPWFDESHAWIGTLEPKPTKKPNQKRSR